MKHFILLLLFVPFISIGQTTDEQSGVNQTSEMQKVNAVSNSFVVGSKYIRIPVQTTATINAIPSPAEGMIVFDETEKRLKIYNGFAWTAINSSRRPFLLLTSANITLNETHDLIICPLGTIPGTITLPAASSFTGKVYRIINYMSSSSITISQYIDLSNSTRFSILSGQSVELISDGSVWRRF